MSPGFALEPNAFVRSLDASRDTLGKPRMKLLEVLDRTRELTGDAPYAVIGGLAQTLWARKTHTHGLDVVLATTDLTTAYARIRGRYARRIALIAFKNAAFNSAIIATAVAVPELGNIRFVRPELLLVTHLLRPGPSAALAAIELVIARRAAGGFAISEVRRWAEELERAPRLDRVLEQAAALDSI